MINVWIHSNIARLANDKLDWRYEPENEQTELLSILQNIFSNERNLFFGIIDETGKVRKHINIFKGTTNIKKLNGLQSVIKNGEEISIFTAVSGG
jgi:molybdopterin converting factor small subunit